MTATRATTDPWLLYGAYGYTGRLVVERALERGLRPVLAGRDAEATRRLAEASGLEWRAFPLDGDPSPHEAIRDMRLVLNVAGPFSATWRPMLEACVASGCSYLDITGEMDERAAAAGVHVVPAVGFDVVPTDCAAAMAAGRLEGAIELDIAFHVSGGPSRGTARTTLERLGMGGAVRRLGRIESVPIGSIRKTVRFSDRSRQGVAIPWGDVSTAYRSTDIPNIRVFATLPRGIPAAGRVFGAALGVPWVRRLAEWATDQLVTGPSRRELAEGHARIRAEVRDGTGRTAAVELVTPNAYALTATAAVAAVERVLSGAVGPGPGVHTPSRAFGADFVTGLPGVVITEVLPA
jgi:saccharopine dehydrogenase (NAD+, L-lysine-forming)